jgi:hypothetical protein
MWILMERSVKRSLLNGYRVAVATDSYAVGELRRGGANSWQMEEDRRRLTVDALYQLKLSLREFETHVRDHGC